MKLDSIAKAYIKKLTESVNKSIENGRIVSIPSSYSSGKYQSDAISSRKNLPYEPIKKNLEIRENLHDETNPVLSSANQYTKEKFGRKIDTSLSDFPPSSLKKQYAIGKAYDLAASKNPEYEKSVFEDYKKNRPDIIKTSGATNYHSLVKSAYNAAEKETGEQFNKIPAKITFHQGDMNYHDSGEMLRDIFLHNHLTAYQGGDRHEFLHHIHPTLGVTSNDILRSVHDYFGHGIHGTAFGPKGEEIAWHTHSQMYSPLARIAVTGETRGQNSNVNYTDRNLDLMHQMENVRKERNEHLNSGRIEEANRSSAKLRELGGHWNYAKQVSVALPSSMLETSYKGELPSYLHHLLKDPESDKNPNYDVDKDHLNLVKLAKHHNTVSHQSSDANKRGLLNAENGLSDLNHIASIHGFSGLTRNPFKESE